MKDIRITVTEAVTATVGEALRPRVGLASQSPRRHGLLRELGLDPVPLRAGIDESRHAGERLTDFIRRLAIEKAQHGATDPASGALPVIGGDTEVCLGETAFGKPEGADDVRRMLRELSDRVHQVVSAVAIVRDDVVRVSHVITDVHFRALSDTDIDHYIDSGEPFGRAGAYAVQGLGGAFVSHLAGSYSAVVGLPVYETAALLREFGIDVLAVRGGAGS
ncbi:MAG: Maf family protein [Pseudomonadota bacterium]